MPGVKAALQGLKQPVCAMSVQLVMPSVPNRCLNLYNAFILLSSCCSPAGHSPAQACTWCGRRNDTSPSICCTSPVPLLQGKQIQWHEVDIERAVIQAKARQVQALIYMQACYVPSKMLDNFYTMLSSDWLVPFTVWCMQDTMRTKKTWCMWEAALTLPGRTRPSKIWLVKDLSPHAFRKHRVVFSSLCKVLCCGDRPLVTEKRLRDVMPLSISSKTTVETCPQLLKRLKDANAIDAGIGFATLTSLDGVARALKKLKRELGAWEQVIAAFKHCLRAPVPEAAREAARATPSHTAAGTGAAARTAARSAADLPYEYDDLTWPLSTQMPTGMPGTTYTEQELKAS